MVIGLMILFLLVLLLPLSLKVVERNLELFLFGIGLIAATLSGVLNSTLFVKAAIDPITISIAVLVAGLLFKWLRRPLENGINGISRLLPYRMFIALIVIFLGIISSLVTAIISALVLVLFVTILQFDRKSEIRLVVVACYSIGLGAALTPIGEPLSTIAISKLDEEFFFLFRLIGPEIIIALIIYGLLAAILVRQPKNERGSLTYKQKDESFDEILTRALKIYFFVMGLTFLGAGFEPLINQYFIGLDASLLYWFNIISAVLDNATLAAAEISPAMEHSTIRALLLGLLISGGMLIPGNIPNIIAAGKLKITSKEWAETGVPIGLITMICYFFIVLFM